MTLIILAAGVTLVVALAAGGPSAKLSRVGGSRLKLVIHSVTLTLVKHKHRKITNISTSKTIMVIGS